MSEQNENVTPQANKIQKITPDLLKELEAEEILKDVMAKILEID